MAKKKFYSLTRYVDKTNGNVKTGYMPQEGFPVPNDYGKELAVYKGVKEGDWKHSFKPVMVWYVVDCYCGIAIGQGDTRREAVDNALKRLETTPPDFYDEKVRSIIEQYGNPPGHKVMFL